MKRDGPESLKRMKVNYSQFQIHKHTKFTGNAATLDMSGLNLFFDLCVMILDKAFCCLD